MRVQKLRKALLSWFRSEQRPLPWRVTRDPYRIWLSEIMLQQTRVQTVIPYYERFLERFPTVEALARAEEGDVLVCWSGLGYYSRARNLHRAAIAVAREGGFPNTYVGLRALPGVGDYTAAAVASIAYGLPYAAVDGNVLRVVARVQNDAADIGVPRTRSRFASIAGQLLSHRDPGAFNQALMELGATVCTPKSPSCGGCPISAECAGYAAGRASELPTKLRKAKPVAMRETLLVCERAGKVLMRLEDPTARGLAGLWALPTAGGLSDAQPLAEVGEFRHTITNHRYTVAVRRAKVSPAATGAGFEWVEPGRLTALPLGAMARKALRLAGIL